MATSYNGWPASDDKASIGVVSSDVFPGGAKAGDVTTVLGYVARQLHARVEPCIDGWNWGYTYKANVNNPSQLSCHASGTAIDWNAPDHPNGSSGTFTAAQVTTIYTILAEVEGAVAWLQGYDEMHFEVCVSAATLAGVAARLGGAAPPSPTPPEDEDMTPYTEAQMKSFAEAGARSFAATQEFRDRVMQACNESLSRNAGAATAQAKTGATQFGATQEFKDRVMVACQEALTRSGLT
jgi:hypothetical protein